MEYLKTKENAGGRLLREPAKGLRRHLALFPPRRQADRDERHHLVRLPGESRKPNLQLKNLDGNALSAASHGLQLEISVIVALTAQL